MITIEELEAQYRSVPCDVTRLIDELIETKQELEKAKSQSKSTIPTVVMNEGGPWLGALRTWIQSNIQNGENVIWGSNVAIQTTPRKLEEAAAKAVAADRADRSKSQGTPKDGIMALAAEMEQREINKINALLKERGLDIGFEGVAVLASQVDNADINLSQARTSWLSRVATLESRMTELQEQKVDLVMKASHYDAACDLLDSPGALLGAIKQLQLSLEAETDRCHRLATRMNDAEAKVESYQAAGTIGGKAWAYEMVCKSLGIENNILGLVDDLRADLAASIEDSNRGRQIIYQMSNSLNPEPGESNIDVAARRMRTIKEAHDTLTAILAEEGRRPGILPGDLLNRTKTARRITALNQPKDRTP
jgi:hypothetical protein